MINSFDVGLSKSRNLALHHAKGDICLIADDDVRFAPGFEQHIIAAYEKYPDASVICFQTETTEGKLYSNYAENAHRLTGRNIKKILSIEVSFKPDAIRNKNSTFNEWFGLGGMFEDSETFLFLRDLVKKRINAFFYPAVIVIHESHSSSDEAGSNRIIYAKMARFYKMYKTRAYLLLLKYVFFLWRKQYITCRELPGKFKTGLKGINDYKHLLAKDLEKR